MTYVLAVDNLWAFAILRVGHRRVDDARHWYSQALLGFQKTFRYDYAKCRHLRYAVTHVPTFEENF
jgi:hypothetical protein